MQTLRFLKFGLWLVRWVPATLVRLLPYLLGLLFYVGYPAKRRIIIANQRQILGRASWPRLQWQAYRILVNAFRNYHVLARLYSMSDDHIRAFVELHGLDHLQAALDRGHGVIILGAHMDGYNALAPFTALFGPPAGAFVEPISPPALFEFVSKIRGRTGLELLLANREGAAAALRLLRRNGILLVAGDRYLGTNGATVEFFGRPAPLPHGPVVLALRNDTPILPATLRRVSHDRLVVTLRAPLPLVDTGHPREDIAANMRLVAGALEETIREAPHQWLILDPVWPAAPTAEPAASAACTVGPPGPPPNSRATLRSYLGAVLFLTSPRPRRHRRSDRTH